MSSGSWALDIPTTPQQRLAARIANIERRIGDFERTRPAVSYGAGQPISTPPIGTPYVDTVSSRMFWYGPSGWISGDPPDVYAETLSQYDTQVLGVFESPGPSVTMAPRASGLLALFVDCEIWLPSSATATVRIQESGAMNNIIETMFTNIPGWVRSQTSGGGTVNGLGGNVGANASGYGGWIVFPAPSGNTTFTFTIAATGGIASVRNRRLYGVML